MKKRTTGKRAKSSGQKALRGKKSGSLRASAETKGDWLGESSMYKPLKRPVTLRLDADLLAWFQAGGRGYQTRINQALRRIMIKERKAGSGE